MTNFVQADPNKVLILDISKWQDAPDTSQLPDFLRMKSHGVSGIIIKCGEANSIDRAFLSYVKATGEAGIPFGVYWYYNNKYSPKKQAQLFASTLKDNNIYPALGMWLDLEDRNPGSYSGWKRWYDFLAEMEYQCPIGIIGIYTGHYYFTEGTVGIPPEALKWFGSYPLWIASYGHPPRDTKPWGGNWTLWQFTDLLDGIQYGVESKELDGNYFNGTKADYYDFFGLEYVSPAPKQLIKIIYVYSDGSKVEVAQEQK